MSLLAHYKTEAVRAEQTHATALRVKDALYAKIKAMEKEQERLNSPSCPLSLEERAAKLTKIANTLPLSQTELRLARQTVEQAEVRISLTKSQLLNAQITERNLRNRIALAEEDIRKITASEIPASSRELFRGRAERDLDALRQQYTQLAGEENETPLEAA